MSSFLANANTTSGTDFQTVCHISMIYLAVVLYYDNPETDEDGSFPKAGKYMYRRLKGKWGIERAPLPGVPDAENADRQLTLCLPFKTREDFIARWDEIHQLSSNGRYILKQVSVFGHSNQFNLLFYKGVKLSLNEVSLLKKLNWGNNGIIVLHTCRAGRLEKSDDNMGETCFALELSRSQKTQVIGQWMFANFSKAKSVRIRISGSDTDVYLWGYKSGGKVKKVYGAKGKDKYNEYDFVPYGCIWACGLYQNGVLKARDINDVSTDLKYI